MFLARGLAAALPGAGGAALRGQRAAHRRRGVPVARGRRRGGARRSFLVWGAKGETNCPAFTEGKSTLCLGFPPCMTVSPGFPPEAFFWGCSFRFGGGCGIKWACFCLSPLQSRELPSSHLFTCSRLSDTSATGDGGGEAKRGGPSADPLCLVRQGSPAITGAGSPWLCWCGHVRMLPGEHEAQKASFHVSHCAGLDVSDCGGRG